MAKVACGIVGLPNVGKSTLFNAVTTNQAEASNYPFCTIDPNVGAVEVTDPRLKVLSDLSKSKQILYATIEFVDIAGLVEGASQGQGLGNKFLANIRETDAIIHVVRCFESDDIVHVAGEIDPIRDVEVINLELMLADLQMVENSLQKLQKQVKGNKELQTTIHILERIKEHLDQNQPVRTFPLTDEEREAIRHYPFLTAKKVLYAANVHDTALPEMETPLVQKLRDYAAQEGNLVVPFCAKLEEEIAQLPEEERLSFLEEMGLHESGLQRIVNSAFEMLGLITFLTTGEMETRAWTIPKGCTAVEAAGKIHTDIQKGFIRAEVVPYDEIVKHKGRHGAKEAGRLRSEGREYVVKDGDVILFLHN